MPDDKTNCGQSVDQQIRKGSSNDGNLNMVTSSTSLNTSVSSNINNNSNNNNVNKLEKKQSNKSVRSPLPINHALSRQHTSNTTSHHRQYVLLRDKSQQQPLTNLNTAISNNQSPLIIPESNPQSPLLLSDQSNVTILPNHPKPYLRKQPSVKYIFSVDDNEDEIEEDLNREYLEGYTDGLRKRIKPPHLPVNSSENTSINNDRKKEIESDLVQTLSQAAKDINELKDLEADVSHNNLNNNRYEESINSNERNDIITDNISDSKNNIINNSNNNNNNNNNNNSSNNINNNIIPLDDDVASITSNESFTLRERQVAINETHPFGIRIWKPAIYKKDRSVQKEAELDIHGVPGSKPIIGYSVKFFNFIWASTFGLLLYIICFILGSITFFISILTSPKNNNSLQYSKFYWSLGKYLFYPFGKIVLLKSDKNYINEDANVGSSLDEFERWRTQNQGKLFFSAPNTNKRRVSMSVTDPEGQVNSSQVNNSFNNSEYHHGDSEDDDDEENITFYKKRYFGRGQWNIGRIIFYFQYYLVLLPIGLIIALLTWLSIFCIPMAKVLFIMSSHIRRHPLALTFEDEAEYYTKTLNNTNGSFLILTYRSFGIHYYKYTVDGTNIFFINLNFLVIFTIMDFYFLKESFGWDNILTNSTGIFGLCLISIIPLAYFIGQAVASISAQTSMGLGAVINAFFSTVVEIYLYCIALDQSKAKLVEGSIIGSILGAVLLLPGGSMCFGAIRRKTQRYNPQSAGVSSTMLLYAIIVMLSPTILYEIYGEYTVKCQACSAKFGEDCKNCHYFQPSVVIDPLYVNYLRPFTVICAVSLFLVYCICLVFTLKTHAALIWSTPINNKEKKIETPIDNLVSESQSLNSFNLNEQCTNNNINNKSKNSTNLSLQKLASNNQLNMNNTIQPVKSLSHLSSTAAPPPAPLPSGGHDAPNWSRTKSTTILLGATLLYAIIAEILVDCVDDVLKSISIDPKFLGLTIFALVPNTTEFVNAFSFAMHGNVALSMEIGSAYALQVCLLQIPFIVLYSVYNFTKGYNGNVPVLINKNGSLPRLTQILGLSSKILPVNEAITANIGAYIDNIEDNLTIGVDKIFSLIFPHWDFIASLLGVYMFTYIYTEGKSNYFKGSILIFLYIVLISGFFIALSIDKANVLFDGNLFTAKGRI